jgi:DNA-binding MarR family transcriptional regulator
LRSGRLADGGQACDNIVIDNCCCQQQLETLQPIPRVSKTDRDNREVGVSEQAGQVRRAARSAKSARMAPPQRDRQPRAEAQAARRIALDGLEGHLGYLTRRAQLWIFQDFRKTLAPLDIRPAQYSVLTVIDATPGLTQMALGHALGIERSRLVHLLDDLEQREFLLRKPSLVDRRSHALHLTPEGRAFLAQVKALAAVHERNVAVKIGPRHHKQLLQLLTIFAK